MPDFYDPNSFTNFAPDPMAGFRLMPQYTAPAAVAAPIGGTGGGDSGLMSSLSSWMKSSGILGSYDPETKTQTQGWGGLALGAGQGIFNGWLGMQQLGLARDTFNENKRQFNLNFDAQKKTLNSRMEDRQRARVASNAGAYQSVGDYMQQNRI